MDQLRLNWTEPYLLRAEQDYGVGDVIMPVSPTWDYPNTMSSSLLSLFFSRFTFPEYIKTRCVEISPDLANVPIDPSQMTAQHHQQLCQFMTWTG